MGIEMLYKCKTCKQIYLSESEAIERFKNHVVRGEVFSAPCKLNARPSIGRCTLKEHYESCQTPQNPLKNNWMCWRDRILIEV